MKKYFQFIIAVAVCFVALASCGDDNDEPQYKVKGDAIDLGL